VYHTPTQKGIAAMKLTIFALFVAALMIAGIVYTFGASVVAALPF
jgi:hypothetical protein